MEDTTFLEGANLAGITTLMNNLHINEQANLEELEKQVMGKQQSFPTDHFDEELNGLAKSLGINFNDPEFSLDSPHSVISKKPSGRGRDKVHGGIRRDSVCTDSICSVIVYVAAVYAVAAYAVAVYAMAVYAAAVCAMTVCAAVRRAEALHATVVHVMTAVILFLRIEKNMQSLRHLKKQLFLKEIVKTTMLKASIVKKVLNLAQSK
uniref:PB407L n=1 Tax=African swine fever virus TaxID=10497 RepID=A0A7G2FMZ0_ASF|nr:pB407L [African swine fever virus]